MIQDKCTYTGNVNTINNIKSFFFELSNERRLSNVSFINKSADGNADFMIKDGVYSLTDAFNELSSDATRNLEIKNTDSDTILSDKNAHEKEILEEIFVTLRNIADVECMHNCRITVNKHSKVFIEGEYTLCSSIESFADILEDVFIEKYESRNNE